MTKRITVTDNNYYFMLCGSIKKGDKYTIMNCIGGDINNFKTQPVLFMNDNNCNVFNVQKL